MKKRTLLACLAISTVFALASCSSPKYLIPQAASSVNYVSFEELNLTNKDYVVLDRVEASARIVVKLTKTTYSVEDPDGTFSLQFVQDKKSGALTLNSFKGVVRAGYLGSSIGTLDLKSPDEVAHRMAMYRLINLVKEQGGDGILEPVVSTNVEETKDGWNSTTITFLTTVSGKIVRLKTSK